MLSMKLQKHFICLGRRGKNPKVMLDEINYHYNSSRPYTEKLNLVIQIKIQALLPSIYDQKMV